MPCPRSLTEVMRRPMVIAQQHPVKKARKPGSSRDPERPPATDPEVRRELTRSAGSRPRSAAGATSRACSTTSSMRPSRCSASTGPACGSTTGAPPPPCRSAAHRGLSAEIIEAISSPAAATPRRPGWTRSAEVGSASSIARCAPRPPSFATSIARSASGRSASCPLVFGDEPLGLLVLYHREAYALDARRAGARPRVRRPHGDRHRQRAAGRVAADPGRPPALDRRPRRPPEPARTT